MTKKIIAKILTPRPTGFNWSIIFSIVEMFDISLSNLVHDRQRNVTVYRIVMHALHIILCFLNQSPEYITKQKQSHKHKQYMRRLFNINSTGKYINNILAD